MSSGPGDGSAGTDARAASRKAAHTEFLRAERELEASAGDCASACRALGSMERATEHLCGLADGPNDRSRCEDAKQKLASARERVYRACRAC